MRRRTALLAGLAAAGGVRAAAEAQDRAAEAAAVVAWTGAGVWIGRFGAALEALPGAMPIDAVPPLPVDGGLWSRSGERRVGSWRRDPAGDWARAAGHEFDAPVHALAASADGAYALAAHGESLSLIDAAGTLVRRYEGRDLQRRHRGRARRLFHLSARRSFVASLPDLGELWEIALDPAAEPVYDGLVHDYRMGEGIAQPGHLGVRRSPLGTPMADVDFADGRQPWVAGRRGEFVDVVHLDVRRRIAAWRADGALPSAALARRVADGWRWWLPVGDVVQVVDTARWTVVERIDAPGRVRQLQALGDEVWALCGDGAAAQLVVRRGDRWDHVPLSAGLPRACHADAARGRLLVGAGPPARLIVLDADARERQVWALPGEQAPAGVRWLPHGG